jgi:hypothetical protein
LDSIHSAILSRLEHITYHYIVQSEMEGQNAGFVGEPSHDPNDPFVPCKSILFVSTPIKQLGNKVIVVVSSVGPEQTTIFLIDSCYSTKLVYDSFRDAGRYKWSIGSIYRIVVKKKCVLELYERMEPGGWQMPLLGVKNRVFILDASNGTVSLRKR